jgi:hypothetical protein
MNTKHKVIWVVIGVFASILVLMVLLGKQSPKTIEKFEDDDDDAFTEETPISKTKDTKEVKEVKATKEEDKSINYVKETMNYIKSLELPFTQEKAAFENLFDDKNTKVLEKFTSVHELQDYVSDMIDAVTGKKKVEVQKEQFEENNTATFDSVKKTITKLDEAVNELKDALATYTTYTNMPKTTSKAASAPSSPIVNERFQPSRDFPVKEELTKNEKGEVIEGFENVRYAFASY